MKNRIFVTLILATGFTLPALAQQPNSNSSAPASASQNAPASQTATATGKEPLETPRPTDFWDGEEPGLGPLIMHPFATKKYVKRQTQPIHDRLNELDELTNSNRTMIRDVDTRAQKGIQLASDRTKLADDHAADATSKAQMAGQTAADVNAHLSRVETKVGNIDSYKSGSLTEIRFRPGQSALSKQAKEALDAIGSQVKGQHGYILEVRGFSAGGGQTAIANSRKMADAVVRYMVLNNEIPAYRIYVLGMGNADSTSKTRVEVSVLKNDLEQTAKQ